MTRAKPKPGDFVCVRKTDDILIKEGSCGVIQGEVGKRKRVYSVTFNPMTPWWYQGVVNASGGPVRIVKAKHMKPTSERRTETFHYFPGLPAAGAAETKKKKINIFETDLTKR